MTSEINLFNDRLKQQLQILELEYQQWSNKKVDYDALGTLLQTLADTTTKAAMIPIGKLAFMPGKLIHTNEILTSLGDQYYAERSTKQAIEILSRRKENVNQSLSLVEAKINSLKSKSKSLLDTGILSEAQINEEGLPIMEIREEWPEEEKKIESVKDDWVAETLPPSVQRARDLLNQKPVEDKTDEDKALFEMLKELEKEEEEEEGYETPNGGQKKPWLKQLNEASDQEEESDEDERYDMEIAEDIFDKFAEENDEEYPLDGIVDQDDFTYYDQDESLEKSTPAVITKPKNKSVVSQETPQEEIQENKAEPTEAKIKSPLQMTVAETIASQPGTPVQEKSPKKMSRFKVLKQQERRKAPVEPSKEEQLEVAEEKEKPKKVSKFKQMKQQEKEAKPEESPKEEAKEVKPEESLKEETKEPVKKMSKFKLMKQQERKKETVEPMKEEPAKESAKEEPKEKELGEECPGKKAVRKVTWDANTTVIEHENHDAPSVLSETSSYSEPIKNEAVENNKIRSTSDLAKVIRQTPVEMVDDYPSLDEDVYQAVDMNELIKVAHGVQEPFYRPTDGAMVPIPRQVGQQEGGIIIAKKSKLDNKIMKGSVMERETVDVDLDELEDDMDLREITTKYHEKRQQILAATGSLSFEPKPEFEVYDEDLPLPNKQPEAEEEEEEEFVPKKMSRFKAARLGIKDY